jgi:hypothetical protein
MFQPEYANVRMTKRFEKYFRKIGMDRRDGKNLYPLCKMYFSTAMKRSKDAGTKVHQGKHFHGC